jgi:hypothetical protein
LKSLIKEFCERPPLDVQISSQQTLVQIVRVYRRTIATIVDCWSLQLLLKLNECTPFFIVDAIVNGKVQRVGPIRGNFLVLLENNAITMMMVMTNK